MVPGSLLNWPFPKSYPYQCQALFGDLWPRPTILNDHDIFKLGVKIEDPENLISLKYCPAVHGSLAWFAPDKKSLSPPNRNSWFDISTFEAKVSLLEFLDFDWIWLILESRISKLASEEQKWTISYLKLSLWFYCIEYDI